MASRTTSRLRAMTRNRGFRLGFAFAPSMLLGFVVPEVGCGGTESWCDEAGGWYSRGEVECGAFPACSWAFSCREHSCSGIVPQSNCENTARCIWDPRGSGCVMDTNLIECESITDGAAYSTHSYCSWSIGCTANRSIDCDSAKSQAACEGLGRC